MWKRTFGIPLLSLCVVGFFVGIFLVKVMGISMEMLEEDHLRKILDAQVERGALLYIVGKLRLGTALIIVIASTTYLAKFTAGFLTFRFGMGLGSFLSCALLKYGIKGILLLPAGFFPQYLLYLPGFYLLIRWGEQIHGMICQREKTDGRKGFFLFAAALFLILLGIVSEGWINPVILKGILGSF